MSIVSRMRDLVRAQLAEMTREEPDPIASMGRTIRQLEEALTQFRREVTETRASCRLLEHRLEQAGRERVAAGVEAAAAVAAGNDAVARDALRRQMGLAATEDSLHGQVDSARRLAEQLKDDLVVFEHRLEEARLTREGLIARHRASHLKQQLADHAARLDGLTAAAGPAGGVDPALYASVVACEENLQRMAAASDALKSVLAEDPEQLFNRLKLERAVEDELADLKASRPNPTGGTRPRRPARRQGG